MWKPKTTQSHRIFNVSVFDKQIPVADDHKKVHAVYRKLVSENISHERLHTFEFLQKKIKKIFTEIEVQNMK